MSRSKRFSGNLIVQPEAIEDASEQGGFGVLSCVRGYIALVGETRPFHALSRKADSECNRDFPPTTDLIAPWQSPQGRAVTVISDFPLDSRPIAPRRFSGAAHGSDEFV